MPDTVHRTANRAIYYMPTCEERHSRHNPSFLLTALQILSCMEVVQQLRCQEKHSYTCSTHEPVSKQVHDLLQSSSYRILVSNGIIARHIHRRNAM